jgi:hypothetical protein
VKEREGERETEREGERETEREEWGIACDGAVGNAMAEIGRLGESPDVRTKNHFTTHPHTHTTAARLPVWSPIQDQLADTLI